MNNKETLFRYSCSNQHFPTIVIEARSAKAAQSAYALLQNVRPSSVRVKLQGEAHKINFSKFTR